MIRSLFEKVWALTDDQVLILVAGLSLATLAGAHGFERFANLLPCPLCLDQREAYWAAITFSLLGLASSRSEKIKHSPMPLVCAGLVVVALIYGTYLAGYHTGIEQKWWSGPTSCTANASLSIREMLENPQSSVVLCDEIPWSLFGISLAGYNFLISLALTVFAAIPVVRRLPSLSARREG